VRKTIGNILISSVSGKTSVIRWIKEQAATVSNDIRIIGGDADALCTGRYFTDDFWHMPPLEELSFENLLAVLLDKKIRFLVPTRDGELLFYAKHKTKLKEHGIDVMVSDEEALSVCQDKLLFYRTLRDCISVTQTELNVELLQSSLFVVKERHGSGSRGIGLALDKAAAKEHARQLDAPLYQPYIQGIEISVDAYVTLQGNVHGIVLRSRDKVSNGESQITTSLSNEMLANRCMEVFQKLHLYGHCMLQGIMTENGQFHILECNARFGGASSLSQAMGMQSFFWFLQESMGQSLEHFPFQRSATEKRMIRYTEELFV
jgi:carbamoyl-phosphate synthase large subunit